MLHKSWLKTPKVKKKFKSWTYVFILFRTVPVFVQARSSDLQSWERQPEIPEVCEGNLNASKVQRIDEQEQNPVIPVATLKSESRTNFLNGDFLQEVET